MLGVFGPVCCVVCVLCLFVVCVCVFHCVWLVCVCDVDLYIYIRVGLCVDAFCVTFHVVVFLYCVLFGYSRLLIHCCFLCLIH